MDITEVSKACGLPSSTLRFYEEKGLIQSSGRSGLRRLFHNSVIEQLALISLARNAGFSLDEISNIFTSQNPEIKESEIKNTEINRALLLAKADELDKKIKELSAMRDGLRHAAACKAANHFECPTFLRILNIAGKNRTRHSNKLKSPQ